MVELKDIYSQFKKDELLSVAKELEVNITPEKAIRVVTQTILDDIQANGVPEDISEISDTLFEFLMVAGYIDEDGNILEDEEETTEDTVDEEDEVPDWLCYGYADSRDPACNKCSLMDKCTLVRISNRPECFGIAYAPNEPECQICIEAPFCRKELSNKEK